MMPPQAPLGPARPAPIALSRPSLGELAGEAAKAWLTALIEARPLARAGGVPIDAMAAEGPGVCERLLRALGSDAELEWLTGTEQGRRLAASATALSGADDPESAIEAIECLRRGVLAVVAASGIVADAPGLAAVGDRLAHVCARLAAVALAGETRRPRAAPAELVGAADRPAGPRIAAAPEAGAGEEQPGVAPSEHAGAPARPLWLAALERQLAEGGRSGRRFALLLVDVDGADRLRLAESPLALGEVFGGVRRAIREQLRRVDLLAHEEDGRIWVIAPDAGRAGGQALAARLARAVETAGRLRGAPLTASVGMSVYPEDGRDAKSLTEQAEEQMFAARAAGERWSGGGPPEPASRGA